MKRHLELPYARHHNPLLSRDRSWILTIHKDRVFWKTSPWKNVFDLQKVGLKQTAGYNGVIFNLATLHCTWLSIYPLHCNIEQKSTVMEHPGLKLFPEDHSYFHGPKVSQNIWERWLWQTKPKSYLSHLQALNKTFQIFEASNFISKQYCEFNLPSSFSSIWGWTRGQSSNS